MKIVLIGSIIGIMIGIYATVSPRFRDTYFRSRHLEAETRIALLSPLIWIGMCNVVAAFMTMGLECTFRASGSLSRQDHVFLVLVSLATVYYECKRWNREH